MFTHAGTNTDFNLLSFWQWASSDLVSNVLRGVLAEYLVARALRLADGIRDPWRPYDLQTPAGLTIEVKSGAYLQSWWQRKHTDISFTIGATRSWNADNAELDSEQRRQAMLYVFAVLRHRDKATVNPLELDQWEFQLIETDRLTAAVGAQESISLSALLKLGPTPSTFHDLARWTAQFEARLLGAR